MECKLDIYTPEERGFETIVWFHGGGLVCGKKECGKELAEDFVKAGYAFVSVEYRMYPDQARFPDYICDCAKAIAFIKNIIKDYGGDGNKIYVSGQSAGAWIALMLCLNEKYLADVGIKVEDICGWLIDSAQTTSHFNVLKYECGEDEKAQRINEFAPIYYVSDKMSFSKMLLMFYENDMPCRYEQNMLFYKAVLYFNQDADITYRVLKGGHCQGSGKRDENGEFEYVQISLQCLKKWQESRF
ncbi:MAG: alpha/beta hydrolase [Clostridia bacterium]|nr:alpha/beta hydrolase [Clostridia bacterium]